MFGKMKIKAEICNYVVYSVNKKNPEGLLI